MTVSYERNIRWAMLEYVAPPKLDSRKRKPNLKGWELTPETQRLLTMDANALLFGVILDRQVTANSAWEGPRRLRERLGHLDIRRIARMQIASLTKVLARQGDDPAIHRLTGAMAKSLVGASKRLIADYRGDAANIWARDPGVSEVQRRLLEFDGIGQKLANMTVRLLITYFAVRLSGWDKVDIAVDRHVARVFLRTGLVGDENGPKKIQLGSLRDDVIQKARSLNPTYPGALDEPAFLIGKNWCNAEKTYCHDPQYDECPLDEYCHQDRRNWRLA